MLGQYDILLIVLQKYEIWKDEYTIFLKYYYITRYCHTILYFLILRKERMKENTHISE